MNALDRGKNWYLILAAKKGHVDVAKVLIQNEADVNAVDEEDRTPPPAAENGHLEVLPLRFRTTMRTWKLLMTGLTSLRWGLRLKRTWTIAHFNSLLRCWDQKNVIKICQLDYSTIDNSLKSLRLLDGIESFWCQTRSTPCGMLHGLRSEVCWSHSSVLRFFRSSRFTCIIGARISPSSSVLRRSRPIVRVMRWGSLFLN